MVEEFRFKFLSYLVEFVFGVDILFIVFLFISLFILIV